MSDAFYIDLRDNTVAPLLKEFGFDMVLTSSREPVVDPNTGAVSAAATPVSTTVLGLFRFFSKDEINGKDIFSSDIQCLIEAKNLNTAGVVPDSAMQLIAKGITYNVVRVTPTQPGGIPVLFRLQIRR